uniref:Uncharacterized protein n=1 Tax=Panagrolaimus sp. ES5 TaxID=591445 RepID=A0AC34FQH5_9BILA
MGNNGGAVSTVLRDGDKNRRKAYFWCAPAWLWLIIIVSVECILMAGWITREYFFFDYTCLLLHQNRSNSAHSTTFGPRLIYGSPEAHPKKRNLRFLEFNSTIPKFVGDVDLANSEPYAYIYDTKGHLIDDESAFVFDEPIILESDYQQLGDNNHRRYRSKRSPQEAIQTTPSTPTFATPKPKKYVIRRRKKQPTPLTTMQSIVSIEQLPLSGEQGDQGKLMKIKTTKIKSFPSNSTLIKRRRKKKPKSKLASAEHRQDDGNVQQEEQQQNKNQHDNHYYPGQEGEDGDRRRLKKLANEGEEEIQGRTLRAYKGAARRGGKAKPKPKDPKATSAPTPTLPPTSATTTASTPAGSSSDTSTTVTSLPSNATTPIVMSEVVIKAVAEAIEKGKDEKDKDDETTTTSTIPTATSPAAAASPTVTFSGFSQDYKGEEEIRIDSSHQPRAIPEQPKSLPKDALKPEHNFQVQIETFSTLALCIARTLFDFWCVAQLIASFPFLFGICMRIRCLFIARLMLDALFLVILFIYTITIIAFSIILYILVDEMTAEVVIEWLIFGILLLVSMLIYIFTFTITLRCCELVLNERTKPYKEKRSKSLMYTEIASDQMLEVADEV